MCQESQKYDLKVHKHLVELTENVTHKNLSAGNCQHSVYLKQIVSKRIKKQTTSTHSCFFPLLSLELYGERQGKTEIVICFYFYGKSMQTLVVCPVHL